MKVSVLMICYNQEAYIADAVNSVLMQEVNFEYEIVIGEDCSIDQTRQILLELKNKHPDKIKLILHEKNVGMHANFEGVFDTCTGEYIAVLEGDDYWTAKDKLQRQVDIMERSPELSECFHKVTTVYQDQIKEKHEFPEGITKNVFVLEDIISAFFIPTLSILFRKSAIHKLPAIFFQMTNPDWLLHVLCAENGNVGFIDDVLGVYRVHNGGVWSGAGRLKVLEKTILSAHLINAHLNFQFNRILKKRIAGWHLRCVWILLVREFAIIRAVKHFLQLVHLIVFNGKAAVH